MRSIARWRAAAVSFVLLAGCVSSLPTRDAAYEPMPNEPAPVDTGGNDVAKVDGARCNAVIEQHLDEGASHVPCTSATNYQSMPPSSGNHYGCWPEYRTFDVPVPWGHLVHALEHGAVVIVYNCGSTGCPDEVALAQNFIDGLPPDPVCPANRVILAPDPTLDVRWAATAWTWTLRADCFDDVAFGQFFTDHYSRCCEVNVCSGGAPFANLCDGVSCG